MMRLPSVARDVIMATAVATLPAILAASLAYAGPAIAADVAAIARLTTTAVAGTASTIPLPLCGAEDGSVGPVPCYWDGGPNGQGDVYVILQGAR